MDIRELFVDGFAIFQVLASSDDVLNVDVNVHCRRIGEIAQPGLLREHQLGCAVVLVYLWSVQMKVLKVDKYLQRILSRLGVVVVFDAMRTGLNISIVLGI